MNSLRTQACLVCDSVAKRAFDFMCQYQSRLETDVVEQDSHARRGGFCAFHTWQYNQLSSSCGVCAGNSAFLQSVGERLLAIAAGAMATEELLHELERCPAAHPACGVCELTAKAEEEALAEALSGLKSATAMNNTVPLLCFPHLVALASRCTELDKIRLLLERHGEEFKGVAEEMRQYIDKFKNLRRDLITHRERVAAWYGLILLAGRSESRF